MKRILEKKYLYLEKHKPDCAQMQTTLASERGDGNERESKSSAGS
jgi:acyl CoA:acetate/3-ketoacid CoA transferase